MSFYNVEYLQERLAAVCKERDELRADNKRLNEAYEAMSRDLERMSNQLAAARRKLEGK